MRKDESEPRRKVAVPGVLLGAGLGGLVDGIVLHQLLQWHHLLTDHGRYERYPRATVADLEDNTLWDGVFHAGTLSLTTLGALLLWRAVVAGRGPTTWRRLVGSLFVGWGSFNLIEGVVSHHLFGLHHVRDDVSDPLWWDLGFLAAGVVLISAGITLLAQRASPGPDGENVGL